MSSLRQLSPPQALALAQYLLKLLEKYSGEPHSHIAATQMQILYVAIGEQG